MQRLIAAAAALAGRTEATDQDLWPVLYAVPTEAGQRAARDALKDQLAASRNPMLRLSAEEASLGPFARADRILGDARLALSDAPPPSQRIGHQLRLEGILREIDSSFALETIPVDLKQMRERLVSEVTPKSRPGTS